MPSLAAVNLYGAAVDEILAVDDGSGTNGAVQWSLADHEASVRDIVDDTGTLAEHRDYTAYGEMSRFYNTGAEIPDTVALDFIFAFTGREWDEDINLANHRARWYDPQAARFINQDPSGFAGGDANLYRYAGNNPVIFVDPSGLCPQGSDADAFLANWYISSFAGSNWSPDRGPRFGDSSITPAATIPTHTTATSPDPVVALVSEGGYYVPVTTKKGKDYAHKTPLRNLGSSDVPITDAERAVRAARGASAFFAKFSRAAFGDPADVSDAMDGIWPPLRPGAEILESTRLRTVYSYKGEVIEQYNPFFFVPLESDYQYAIATYNPLNVGSNLLANTAQVGGNSIAVGHSSEYTLYQMGAYPIAEATGVTNATYIIDNTDPVTGRRAGQLETYQRTVIGGVQLVGTGLSISGPLVNRIAAPTTRQLDDVAKWDSYNWDDWSGHTPRIADDLFRSPYEFPSKSNRANFLRKVERPQNLVEAPEWTNPDTGVVSKRGHAWDGRKHHKTGLSKPQAQEVVNNPDRVYTGTYQSGRPVDVYYKDVDGVGRVVVTEDGVKHSVITAYRGRNVEPTRWDGSNLSRWKKSERYVEVTFPDGPSGPQTNIYPLPTQ